MGARSRIQGLHNKLDERQKKRFVEMYTHSERYTIQDIATRFGALPDRIHRWAKQLGLPPRSGGPKTYNSAEAEGAQALASIRGSQEGV